MKIDATTIIEYTYEEFEKSIESLVTQASNSDFSPDFILGVIRGGAVPAVYLSHKLKLPVRMIQWSLRDSAGTSTTEVLEDVANDIANGRKVLIVDDIVDGGDTIDTLLNDLGAALEPERENVRVAALWYNPSQPIKVDFYDRVIDREVDSRWVVFPWEA